jgi:hypothetical protein
MIFPVLPEVPFDRKLSLNMTQNNDLTLKLMSNSAEFSIVLNRIETFRFMTLIDNQYKYTQCIYCILEGGFV